MIFDSNSPLKIPTEICCNCLSQDNVETIETDLRYMPLFGLAGAEVTLPTPLPYCPICKSSAKRKRPGLLGFLASCTLVFAVLAMIWLFYLSTLFTNPISEYIFIPIIAVISLTLNAAFFFFKKINPNQSSYYQPVKLNKVRGAWPNSIKYLSLSFTNPEYKKMFIEVNEENINNKCLKVR